MIAVDRKGWLELSMHFAPETEDFEDFLCFSLLFFSFLFLVVFNALPSDGRTRPRERTQCQQWLWMIFFFSFFWQFLLFVYCVTLLLSSTAIYNIKSEKEVLLRDFTRRRERFYIILQNRLRLNMQTKKRRRKHTNSVERAWSWNEREREREIERLLFYSTCAGHF